MNMHARDTKNGYTNKMTFDNRTIVAPRWNKPHIVLSGGYYRVSPSLKRYPNREWANERWHDAHAFANARNEEREFGMVTPGGT